MIRRPWWWLWGPAFLQMAAIFVASSIPDLGALPGGVSDKTGHSVGYALLGALVLRGLSGGRFSGVTWRTVAAAIALSAAYGVSDEFHQSFVPGRTPDVMDVVADAVGATGAAILLWVIGALWAWGILRSSSGPEGPVSR
jgi:VanZ family protein